jgi:predicted RND superfamily exporter protein
MNVESLMTSFSKWVIRWRWLILLLVVLITAGLVHSTQYLTVNNDFDTWSPKNERVTELARMVDRQFGANYMVFAVLDFTEKGVFDPESLALVQRMTDALDGMPELFSVSSLTNIVDIRKTDYGLQVGDLIPEIPQTRRELSELEEYVLSKERYVNTLISSDAQYTVLVANIEGDVDEGEAARKVLDTIKEVAGDHPYYFGGDPALIVYADIYMAQDLALLVPLMLVVMIVILAVSFRRFLGVFLPLSFVILGVVWTFGLQAVFGMYLNVLTPAVVVMLIAMGADYAVHIYNHYLKRRDIEVSTAEITLPVLLSTLTTIAGLLTFSTTGIEIFQFFGLELAFGLGSVCLLSILLLPVCIYLLRARKEPVAAPAKPDGDLLERMLARTGEWVHGHVRFVMVAAGITLAVMLTGLVHFTTEVDYVESLPKDCPPRQGHDILRDHFGGIYPASLYVRGDLEDPAVMQIENYLENYLRSYASLSGFNSINDLVAEENWLMNGVYAVPETRQGVANLWMLLEGQEYLRTFVASDRDQSLVTAMIKESDSGVMKEIAWPLAAFLNRQTSKRIVTIDSARLSAEGQKALRDLQLSEAALQLTWLAQGYDKPHKHEMEPLREKLAAMLLNLDQKIDTAPLWQACRIYLDEETVEVLPQELIDGILAHMKENWQETNPSNLEAEIAEIIDKSLAMDAVDARTTAAGVMKRATSTLRLERAETLREFLDPLLPPALRKHKDFRKRADGVLWRLWAEAPVFFDSRVETIPGIEQAIIASQPVEIDQTGAPDWFRLMDELIFASQLQSMILASLIVLTLVSVTQRSFRRGLMSFLSVVVPLGAILGLMSWMRIPLDFGTALVGALIVGLGVDGSIHFLYYYHRLRLAATDVKAALSATMGHVGKAIITANATTCCGFLVLAFSKTEFLRNFALVNSMAILLVTLSILTFLPALITLFRVGSGREDPG